MITTLDALLLFLVGHKSQSGYEIRQIFQSTPLGLFSDSPGAIYPALARLEKAGLLTGANEVGGRRKRVFTRTSKGALALKAWLTQPVTQKNIRRRQSELDLRYVLNALSLGASAGTQLLRQYAKAYSDEVRVLESYIDGHGKGLDTAPRRALELGLRLVRTRRDWAMEVIREDNAED